MYSKDNLVYILTMLEAIEKIFIYSDKFDSAHGFFKANDQLNYNGSNNLLLAIGEESKKLDTDLKNEYPEIPWPLISQLRNRLAHDYRGLDPEIIFNIIHSYLPDLKKVLILMIDCLTMDKDQLLSEVLFSDFYRHLSYLRPDTKKGENP